MDKYAILCIFTLICLCFWFAAMSALIFLLTPDFRVTSDMWLAKMDRWFLISALSIFICIHIGLLTWLYFVPLKYRREMAKKDSDYHRLIFKGKKKLDYMPISM